MLPLWNRLPEPVLEPYRAELGIGSGNKHPFAQFGPEVACLWIADHFAGIVLCAKPQTNELVEAKPFGPCDFNHAIHGFAYRDLGHGAGNIIRRHRLDEDRGETNAIAVGCRRSNALYELEELRGMNDRVRNRR